MKAEKCLKYYNSFCKFVPFQDEFRTEIKKSYSLYVAIFYVGQVCEIKCVVEVSHPHLVTFLNLSNVILITLHHKCYFIIYNYCIQLI